jgi:Tfp pilus assembly protein PilN
MDDSGPETEVLVAAIKKDIAEFSQNAFSSKPGLSLHFLDATPFSVFNAYRILRKEDSSVTMILDIGSESTDITIINRGRFWSRTALVGGNDITRSIKDKLNLNFLQAEEVKCREAKIVIDKKSRVNKRTLEISGVIEPVLSDMLGEITQSMSYFKTQDPQSKAIDRILITGGTSNLPNLDKYIQANLNIGTEKTDLTGETQKSEDIITDPCIEGRMDVALGLALRGLKGADLEINLLTPDELLLQEYRQRKPFIYGSLVLALLISLTVNFNISRSNALLKRSFELDAKEVSGLSKMDKSIFERDIASLYEKIHDLENFSRRNVWARCFTEFGKITPKDIWFDSIRVNNKKAELTGYTYSPLTILNEFTDKMNATDCFKDAEIVEANLVEGGDEKNGASSAGGDTQNGLKIFSVSFGLRDG